MFVGRVFVLALCVYLASAHSWMQCADYTEENGQFWDEKKCRGWPRAYGDKFQFHSYTFGIDAGYNKNPSQNSVCQADFGSPDSKGYNSPSYKPGQRVCMAWPPKNHVAAKCDNVNIKDSGTKILRSGVNPSRDPASLSDFQLVADLGASGPSEGKGFQNCPDFCNNRDKALCTGCFDVPSNLEQGKYVFLWLWEFNPGELYSTCFDVTISNSVNNPAPKALPKVTPDGFKESTGSNSGANGSGDENNGDGNGNNNNNGGYGGGVVAAAVIVTFIAVAAIFVGVFMVARSFPHSKGSFVHQLMVK